MKLQQDRQMCHDFLGSEDAAKNINEKVHPLHAVEIGCKCNTYNSYSSTPLTI